MRQRELKVTGKINADGKLCLYMGEVKEFLAKHPNKRIFVSFSVAPMHTSEALKAYYYKYVVPTMQQAFFSNGERYTEEQTEERLRKMSPVMYEQTPNEETGIYYTRLKEIAEVDNAELIEHIETIRQIAAEEFFTNIEDPRTI